MIQAGAFVWTLFPTREEPRKPGLRHLAYCFGLAPSRDPTGIVRAIVSYTNTTIPLPPYPISMRVFSAAEAISLNQRPFALDIGTVARLPLTRRWFPEFERPQQGVACIAPAGLQNELWRLLDRISSRHPDLIEFRGPSVS